MRDLYLMDLNMQLKLDVKSMQLNRSKHKQ